jgi:hypothetical protein
MPKKRERNDAAHHGTVKERFSVTDEENFILRRVDRNSSGADVGVGFEYMFIPNWTVWVEWDHIFLDHSSIDFRDRFDNIHRDLDKVLVGINWRFGGARSPVYSVMEKHNVPEPWTRTAQGIWSEHLSRIVECSPDQKSGKRTGKWPMRRVGPM